MARTETHNRPAPRFTWRSLAGLFEEAWQREQRRRRWWLLAVVLLAAGAFTAVLTGGGGNGPVHGTHVFALRTDALGSSSSVRSRFALFNQPAASREAVKRSIRNYPGLSNWLTSKSGIGVSHAATHIVHTSEGTVWVVTGPTQACTIIPTGGGAGAICGGLTDRNMIAGTSSRGFNGTYPTWYGLVPNSVKRVIVDYASGPKTTVPVTDNTFLVHLHGPMQHCFTRRTGSEEINLSTTATTLTAYCPH